MDITKLPILKKDERGFLYQHKNMEVVKRKKGTVSANHKHKETEEIFLIDGEAIITVGEETKKITNPSRILIKAQEYHKIEALTDIIIVANKE